MNPRTQQEADELIFRLHGIKRSTKWPAEEKAHLLRQPSCLVCGRNGAAVKLNVHHKYPFHFVVAIGRPDLELDERNLFTLCVDPQEQHHLLVGHYDDFQSYNPDLEPMIAFTRNLTSKQIRSLAQWIHNAGGRPKHLDKMNDEEKTTLLGVLNHLMPK